MIILILDHSNVSDERVTASWKEWFDTIHQWIVTFNLFKQPYNDDHGRRNEILATRIYVLLMSIAIIVIVFYASIGHALTYHVG